jgi:hypothetical protein
MSFLPKKDPLCPHPILCGLWDCPQSNVYTGVLSSVSDVDLHKKIEDSYSEVAELKKLLKDKEKGVCMPKSDEEIEIEKSIDRMIERKVKAACAKNNLEYDAARIQTVKSVNTSPDNDSPVSDETVSVYYKTNGNDMVYLLSYKIESDIELNGITWETVCTRSLHFL